VVRQRSAKPLSAVRFRPAPPICGSSARSVFSGYPHSNKLKREKPALARKFNDYAPNRPSFVLFLYPIEHSQNEHDKKNQAQAAARIIPPVRAIGPSGQTSKEKQDDENEQDEPQQSNILLPEAYLEGANPPSVVRLISARYLSRLSAKLPGRLTEIADVCVDVCLIAAPASRSSLS
jgi:hypothetical protein